MLTPTVLVVEDDKAFRTHLATALADEYAVHATECATEALGFLRENSVAALLVDMAMPDGDGLSVLAYAGAMSPKPHVVVLSPVARPTDAVKAMRLGASDYLVKPCDMDAVRRSIHDALAMTQGAG
jgi:DNA-binding NtrC family response regulator